MDIKKIIEAKKHIDSSVDIVFFDIDNTVLNADGPGATEWACAFEKYVRSYAIKREWSTNYALALATKYISDHIRRMQPKLVENEVVELIGYIKQLNIPMIAITGRPLDTIDVTLTQLKEFGIDFSSHLFDPKNVLFDTKEHPALFQDGIITCNHNKKGALIQQFLRTVRYMPKKVAFIDDDFGFMDDVENAMRESAIDFVGLRYAYLDDEVNNFVLTEDMIPTELR